MKHIITHKSPDLDAITSSWLILRFLPTWEDAKVLFVSAGEKTEGKYENNGEVIEIVDEIETIHVDTGLGKLDHHQTQDNNVCGASLTLEYVLSVEDSTLNRHETKREAVKRIVELVIDDDHFQEFYYPDPDHDRYDFSLRGILSGYKLMYQHSDDKIAERVFEELDALLHSFEAKIWAENEIKEKGIEFETRWGKGLGVETLNDAILKLGQLQGFPIVVRKDPNNYYIRIKAKPTERIKPPKTSLAKTGNDELNSKKDDIDLTSVYQKIKEKDTESTWFLHISKKMLLNGSSKNPDMKGSKLTLEEIIDIIKSV